MTTRIIADAFKPTKDNVFVTELDQGVHMTYGGIIIPDDNMSERGIRARWCKVWKTGPEVTEVATGDWILVEHGRWTTGIDMQLADETVRVWRIEWPKSALLASATDPREYHSVSMPAKR